MYVSMCLLGLCVYIKGGRFLGIPVYIGVSLGMGYMYVP